VPAAPDDEATGAAAEVRLLVRKAVLNDLALDQQAGLSHGDGWWENATGIGMSGSFGTTHAC
jgi:hypothetical protein